MRTRRIALSGPARSGLLTTTLSPDDLGYLNRYGRKIIEPGDVKVSIAVQKKTFTLANTIE
ncbi:hypothetical protein [Pontibacter anaerobius]|uniref:Uncharacterized protein n=1 Tax=Pontibacter anaerobius TaxID=2993940 RepID=A0ABT3RF18_9BACT|nr:hypothetical protein [Pontibacter anaerobius]MCX2739993.1 hypothetical protein [Pontibacter anaerobius]